MLNHTLRIVYMGTPEFAVAPLRALVEGGYNVVAVVTMPDKPAGRGHKLQFSAVKEYALSVGLPVLQPEKLKDEQWLDELRSYRADLQIVVAFRMLPEVVWNMPRLGTFNLHASLLPQYRGAAPINWAVINGDQETGVTTFFLKHEIDTGNIILQERIQIGEDENVGSVHDRLMELGARLVVQTTDLIQEQGEQTPVRPQDESVEMRPAPKIFKDTCEIDFRKTAVEVKNFVRGLSPYPGAWTRLNLEGEELVVKIFAVQLSNGQLSSGEIETDGRKYLRIGCADGAVDVLELQLPGKKRLGIKDVLNGLKM